MRQDTGACCLYSQCMTFVSNPICEPFNFLISTVFIRYVGSWLNNRKNGYGVFYYHTGAIYEGNFVDDLRDGQGKITFLKGSPVEECYEGTWVKDEWHGYGVYRYRKEEGMVELVYSHYSYWSMSLGCYQLRYFDSNYLKNEACVHFSQVLYTKATGCTAYVKVSFSPLLAVNV